MFLLPFIIHLLNSKSDTEVKRIGPPVQPKPLKQGWQVRTTISDEQKEKETWSQEIISSAREAKPKLPAERIPAFTKPTPYKRPSYETEIFKSVEAERQAYQEEVMVFKPVKPVEKHIFDVDVSKPKLYEKQVVQMDIPRPTEKRKIEVQISEAVKTFETMVIGMKEEEEEVVAEKIKLYTTKVKPQISAPIPFSKPVPFEKETIEVKVKGREPKHFFTEIKPETLKETLLPKPKPYEKQTYVVEFPDSEPESKPDVSMVTKPVKLKKPVFETKVHVTKPQESRVTSLTSVTFAETPEKVHMLEKSEEVVDRSRPRSYIETDKSAKKKVQKRSVSFDETVKTDESASEAEMRMLRRKKPFEVTVTGVDWTTSDESTDEIFTKVVKIKRKQSPTPERLVIHGEYFPEKARHKKVRTRKVVRKRTRAEYKPVPYVAGPATTWVPERTNVLQAVESWARY